MSEDSHKQRGRPESPPRRCIAEVSLDDSDEQLLEVMRQQRQLREQSSRYVRTRNVVTCSIKEFNAERRNRGDLPKVQAFCRRLVALGFIACLDLSTSIPDLRAIPDMLPAKLGLGGFEVWAIAQGFFDGCNLNVLPSAFEEFAKALPEAYRKANELLGPP